MTNKVDATTDSDALQSSVRQAAGQGLRWSLAGVMGARLGTFLMGLVLARLLVPADFGIYAIGLGAMAVLMCVNDVGIIAGTVQWRGEINEMAPTATTIALVSSASMYALCWAVAPLFAEFSGAPEATPIVRLLAAAILVDGLVAVRVGVLMRSFRQDTITLANILAMFANAGVSISLAAHGAGAYSLALGNLVAQAVIGIIVMWAAPLSFRLGLDLKVARRLMRFGLPYAACLGVEAVLLNVDYIVVGQALGTTALGFYLLAFNISSWVIVVLGNAVRAVAIPSFSRLAEEEGALSPGVQRALVVLITVALPIGILMAALAPSIVAFLYGAQWAPAADVLRFLAILSVVRAVSQLVVDVLTGVGSTMAGMWMNLVWATALVPALVVGTRLDGIRGTAAAHVAVALLVAIPLSFIAVRRSGVALMPIGRALMRPFVAGIGCLSVALLLAEAVSSGPFIELIVVGPLALSVYVGVATPRAQLWKWVVGAREFVVTRLSRSRHIAKGRND